MALTIVINAEDHASSALQRLNATVSSAFQATRDQLTQQERATQQFSQRSAQHLQNLATSFTKLAQATQLSTAAMGAGFQQVTQGVTRQSTAFRESLSSIQAAIQANTAYAQSLASIAAAQQRAAIQKAPSVFGGAALTGAGAESVASLQAAAKAGVAYQQSLLSIQNASDKFNQAQAAANRTVKEAAVGMGRLSGSVTTLAAGFGVMLGVAGLVGFIRSVVDAGLHMSRFERTLQAATGSLAGAQRAFAFLVAESNRLGQILTVMIPTFVQLTAATRGTVLEGERTRSLFSALVGAGQAVGLSTEGVGRAMIGLVQIISQNAIQLDEFRNQFASQIPGAMRATAIALGEMGITAHGTIAEMLKLMEQQKLSVTDLMTAVTKGLQDVAQTAPDMSNSVEGAFAQFSNAILKLKADIAHAGILEFLGDLAKRAGSLLETSSRFLGVGTAGELKQFDLLIAKQTELIQLRDQFLAEAKDPLGFDPAAAKANAEATDNEIRGIQQQIKNLHALRDIKAGIAKDNDAATAARRQQEHDELKAISDQQKAREAALKAEPARLQALAATEAAMFKKRLDETKAFYDAQRQIAETTAQQALDRAPQEATRIGEVRLTTLKDLAEREATDLMQIRLSANDAELQAHLGAINAEIAAAGGAKDKMIVLEAQKTTAVVEHAAQAAAIRSGMAEHEIAESGRATQKRIEDLEKQRKAEQDAAEKAFQLAVDQTTQRRQQVEQQEQRALDEAAGNYKRFVERVTSSVATIFEQLLSGTLNAVDFFKRLFIATISQIAAEVATKAIIIPIIGQFLGAVGLSNVIGAAGTVGQSADLLNMLGLTKVLGGLSTSIISLDDTMSALLFGTEGLQESLDAAVLQDVLGVSAAPTPAFSTVGVAGGLAAVGGGIYGAVNASNMAAQAAYAASAAAGAVYAAGASGLLAAVGATAGAVGWTGFGLIAAAVLAAIGFILETFLKPKGPRLVVGGLTGAGVGVSDQGQLEMTGSLTATETRSERLGDDVLSSTEAALTQGVESMINAMLTAINEVAVDPSLLLGPAQQALEQGLAEALTLNSSSAKNMQADIQAQLAFIPIQIGSFFLEPLNQAFEQLTTADLDTQLRLLPAAAAGMARTLMMFNAAMAELEQVANDDVERNLEPVKARIREFQQRLVEALLTTLEAGFASATEGDFFKTLVLAASLPAEVAALNPELAGMIHAAQMLVPLYSDVVQQMDALEAILIPVGHQWDEVIAEMAEVNEALADVNMGLAEAIPLYAQMEQLIGSPGIPVVTGPNSLSRHAKPLEVLGSPSNDILFSREFRESQLIIQQANLEIQAAQEVYEAQVEAAQDAVEAQQDLIDALNDELELEQEAYDAALDAIEAQEKLLDAQKDLLDAEQERLDAEQKLIDAQQKALNIQYKALDAQEEVIQKQEKAIQKQEKAIQKQLELIDTQEAEIRAQLKLIDTQEEALRAQNAQLDGLREEIRVREQGVASLRSYMTALERMSAQVHELVRTGQPPVQAAESIRARIGQLQGLAATQTGEDQIDTLSQIIDLNKELVDLGRSTNQLDLQKEGNDNLIALISQIDQLGAQAGTQLTTAEQQLTAAQSSLAMQEQAIADQQALLETQRLALDAQMEDLELQREAFEAQLQGLETQLEGLEAQREAIEEQREALDLIQDSIDLQQDALDAQQESLDAQYEVLNDQYEELQEQTDLLNEEFDAYVDVYNAQLDALEDQMEILQDQLEEAQDTTELDAEIKAIQEQELAALQDLQAQMEAMYLADQELANVIANPTTAMNTMLVSPLPLPVRETNPVGSGGSNPDDELYGGLVSGFQWGGPLRMMQAAELAAQHQRFQMGGYAHFMAEPGELVFPGPLAPHHMAALETVNAMYPRFQVPGSGTGDTVRMRAPDKSFVLNRVPSMMLTGKGYQGGGEARSPTPSSEAAPVTFNISITVQANVSNELDIRTLADSLGRHLEQRITAKLWNKRWGGMT